MVRRVQKRGSGLHRKDKLLPLSKIYENNNQLFWTNPNRQCRQCSDYGMRRAYQYTRLIFGKKEHKKERNLRKI
jgi:hypothetical protein